MIPAPTMTPSTSTRALCERVLDGSLSAVEGEKATTQLMHGDHGEVCECAVARRTIQAIDDATYQAMRKMVAATYFQAGVVQVAQNRLNGDSPWWCGEARALRFAAEMAEHELLNMEDFHGPEDAGRLLPPGAGASKPIKVLRMDRHRFVIRVVEPFQNGARAMRAGQLLRVPRSWVTLVKDRSS